LRILLTNLLLLNRTGTEIVTRDLAFALAERGHQIQVFSPVLGAIADELRTGGVEVTDRPDALTPPDIIHGQHNTALMTVLARFPGVPAIMYVHSRTLLYDVPPAHPRILRYIAVDDTVQEWLASSSIPPSKIGVILNAVPLHRFPPRAPLPMAPQRALAYTKHFAHLPALRTACAGAGLPLDEAGLGTGRVHANPGALLAAYDVVFSSARSALEAMAVGAAVVVCDGRGLAGMVTPENFPAWRRRNFGLATLTRPVEPEFIRREILLYNAEDAAEIQRRVRVEANLERKIEALEDVYRQVLTEWNSSPKPSADADAIALSSYMNAWLPNPVLKAPWDEVLETHIAGQNRLVSRSDYEKLAQSRAVRFARAVRRVPGLARLARRVFDGLAAATRPFRRRWSAPR
jgi:hypothetical protein